MRSSPKPHMRTQRARKRRQSLPNYPRLRLVHQASTTVRGSAEEQRSETRMGAPPPSGSRASASTNPPRDFFAALPTAAAKNGPGSRTLQPVTDRDDAEARRLAKPKRQRGRTVPAGGVRTPRTVTAHAAALKRSAPVDADSNMLVQRATSLSPSDIQTEFPPAIESLLAGIPDDSDEDAGPAASASQEPSRRASGLFVSGVMAGVDPRSRRTKPEKRTG